MVEFETRSKPVCSVAVLFPHNAVTIVDIFRALGDFEAHYDVATLDHLEDRLALSMERESAKGLVSDALLLAFGLRRERRDPIAYAPLHSRKGTMDEYRLLALIGAVYWHDFVVAEEAATALDAGRSQPLISLAFDIARRLEAAGIKLDAPDRRVLRPADAPLLVEVDHGPDRSDRKWNLEI